MSKNFNEPSIGNSNNNNSSNVEPATNIAQWGNTDLTYDDVLKKGQDFQCLGTSEYFGKIEIAYCDGQWHAFADKWRKFSHPDKNEVTKSYAPEAIDEEVRRVDEEMLELAREQEQLERYKE